MSRLRDRGLDSVNSVNCVTEEWEAPVPFDGPADLPPFPADVLPEWLRAWVEAEATALQVPVDLPAMLGLSVCAAAVARKVAVRVREGHVEPTNLYTVTTGLPGDRKSPTFSDATRPVNVYEADEAHRMAPEIAEATTRRKVAEGAKELAEAAAARAKPEERAKLTEAAASLARDIADITVPAAPRLVVDDVTPEALASLLVEQGGRMAVMSPEGDIFDIMAGRYSSGTPNLGVYLKGHAGDTIRVNRRGRAEYIQSPALTLGLAVQPDVLRGLQGKPGFRGRGLLGRFLYSLPTSLVGHRDTQAPPMPPAVRMAYEHGVLALLSLPSGTDGEGNPISHVLRLDARATTEIDAFAAWLEPRMAPTGNLGAMTDWAGKLVGAVVRIAGILHCAEHVGTREPWSVPLVGDTMRAAVRLGREYLIPHAQAAFGLMGADPVIEGARRILRWLSDAGLETFTRREAHRALQGTFPRAADMDEPMRVLEERGYIRALPTPDRPGPGRRPSPDYAAHPSLIDPVTELTQLTQSSARTNSVNSVNSVRPPQVPPAALSAAAGWGEV